MYYTEEDCEEITEDEECVSSSNIIPNKVLDNLFIGGVTCAQNLFVLKRLQISHVLDLTGGKPLFPAHVTYLSIPNFPDEPGTGLLGALPGAVAFVAAALRGGGVLIHCHGGISRAPSVTLAFLLSLPVGHSALPMGTPMTLSGALQFLRSCRPQVQPSRSFLAQLQWWERTLRCPTHSQRSEKCHFSLSCDGAAALRQYHLWQQSLAMTHWESPPSQGWECGNCGTVLFGEEHVLLHPPSLPEEQPFSLPCEGLSVMGMTWMKGAAGSSGTLKCERCAAVVGRWRAHGSECPCGWWAPPALLYPSALRRPLPSPSLS